MKRLVLVMAAFAASFAVATPAFAAEFDPNAMTYPLDGENRITDSFGDPRSGHSHEGVDIMADKGVPVIAVGDGVVTWITDPGDGEGCCFIGIDHGGGWVTRYIHLNDDAKDANGNYIPNTDGQGWGIADGIVKDSVVTTGQLIGWVGDSGNASENHPHLHFELRKDGIPQDPYAYLVHAAAAWTGTFSDDDYSVHQANIDKIFAQGITVGCNPPLNDRFCPERNITRGEMAAFIARALDLGPVTGASPYDDTGGHVFEIAVDKIQTAGIGFGCDADSFCPDRPLTRDEMAELLVRAFTYENPDAKDFFTDDTGNQFEESINALANVGVTVGCNPPTNDQYCPGRELTRAEMSTFFVRALDL